MIKNLLIALGIVIIALMAVSNTVERYKNNAVTVGVTPAQHEMRTPSMQNPGQVSTDINTEKIRKRQNTSDWDKNPNTRTNKLDNFNRNRDRDNMRQYFDKNSTKNRND
jgi:hypothetical protein